MDGRSDGPFTVSLSIPREEMLKESFVLDLVILCRLLLHPPPYMGKQGRAQAHCLGSYGSGSGQTHCTYGGRKVIILFIPYILCLRFYTPQIDEN